MPAHIQLHVYLFLMLCLGGWVYAIGRGGAVERCGALILIAGCLLTGIVAPPIGQHFHRMEVGIACVDLLILVALATLAVRSRRPWTIWMASLQAVDVLSHIPILLRPIVMPEAYTILQGLWAWPMMLLLITATYRHQQRRKRFTTDPSLPTSFVP
jgi:hypothetical protein